MSNQAIWAPKGMTSSVCVKIPYKGYEISIAMDDSCGVLKDYSRSDIRVFRDWDSADVTEKFWEGAATCFACATNLQYIFNQIDFFGERD